LEKTDNLVVDVTRPGERVEVAVSLDDGDAQAELVRKRGCREADRPRTDDEKVERLI
jgi:multidrug resistance efflux pump